jgi:hypothetical protein
MTSAHQIRLTPRMQEAVEELKSLIKCLCTIIFIFSGVEPATFDANA